MAGEGKAAGGRSGNRKGHILSGKPEAEREPEVSPGYEVFKPAPHPQVI